MYCEFRGKIVKKISKKQLNISIHPYFVWALLSSAPPCDLWGFQIKPTCISIYVTELSISDGPGLWNRVLETKNPCKYKFKKWVKCTKTNARLRFQNQTFKNPGSSLQLKVYLPRFQLRAQLIKSYSSRHQKTSTA